MKTSREGDGAFLWEHRAVAEQLVFVGRDDNVGVLDDALKVRVHLFTAELQFEERTIQLVDRHHRSNTFSQSLQNEEVYFKIPQKKLKRNFT